MSHLKTSKNNTVSEEKSKKNPTTLQSNTANISKNVTGIIEASETIKVNKMCQEIVTWLKGNPFKHDKYVDEWFDLCAYDLIKILEQSYTNIQELLRAFEKHYTYTDLRNTHIPSLEYKWHYLTYNRKNTEYIVWHTNGYDGSSNADTVAWTEDVLLTEIINTICRYFPKKEIENSDWRAISKKMSRKNS